MDVFFVGLVNRPGAATHITVTGCAVIFGGAELVFLTVKAQYPIFDAVAPGEHDEAGTIAGIAIIGFGRGTQHINPCAVFLDAAKGDGCAGFGQNADLPMVILECV